MKTVQKKLEVDVIIIDKIQEHFGKGVSFSFIVNTLLWGLMEELNSHPTFDETIKRGVKNALPNITEV